MRWVCYEGNSCCVYVVIMKSPPFRVDSGLRDSDGQEPPSSSTLYWSGSWGGQQKVRGVVVWKRNRQNSIRGYLRKMLVWQLISSAMKVQGYTIIIRQVMLYGIEAWSATKVMNEKRNTLEYGIMRQICDCVYKNEILRRHHNAKLRLLTEMP